MRLSVRSSTALSRNCNTSWIENPHHAKIFYHVLSTLMNLLSHKNHITSDRISRSAILGNHTCRIFLSHWTPSGLELCEPQCIKQLMEDRRRRGNNIVRENTLVCATVPAHHRCETTIYDFSTCFSSGGSGSGGFVIIQLRASRL